MRQADTLHHMVRAMIPQQAVRHRQGQIVGLLDELESEAQRRKSNDDDAAALKAARETAYRTALEPAMGKLFAYLTELVAKLRQLQPKIAIRHALAGYGDVVAYVEHEYDVREARQPSSREITLAFFATVASSECPNVQVEGSARVRAVSALFQRHRLGAPLAASKDASGEIVGATFKAKGRVPLTAVFSADAATGQLRMSFTNFDDFATAVKTVASDQVSEALYDQIGRLSDARADRTVARSAARGLPQPIARPRPSR
jgi:23S rRNA maturation mini-RNase III